MTDGTENQKNGAVANSGSQHVRRGPIDTPLLAVALALTTIGIVMIYSASSVVAQHRFGSPTFFLSRQLLGVAMGIGALVVGMRLDYRWYKRLIYPILGLCFVLLALIFVPGLGLKVGFARRWLMIAGIRFQPAEFAKVAAVIYLAYSVSKKESRMRSFTFAFIPHLLVIGAMVALLLPQPDFGSSAILMVLLGSMLMLGGARLSYLVAFLIAALVMAWDAVIRSPYRMERIQVFLNPEEHATEAGWQITESFLALGSGGLTGRGLGQGHLKLGYVPELWNDFIATIIGHELGMFGLAIVIVLFLVLLWRGIHISMRARDAFGSYLAFGLIIMLTLQAATNLGVVTGLLPTKGLTLPFVSFGRSSIVICLFAIGVLLNISQRNDDLWEQELERRKDERIHRELAKRKARLLANRRALHGRQL